MKHEGKAKYGAAFRQWQVDAANFNIDGHYPVRELWTRARTCWTKILEHEGRSVLVVAHNAVNQALVATAIGNILFSSSSMFQIMHKIYCFTFFYFIFYDFYFFIFFVFIFISLVENQD